MLQALGTSLPTQYAASIPISTVGLCKFNFLISMVLEGCLVGDHGLTSMGHEVGRLCTNSRLLFISDIKL